MISHTHKFIFVHVTRTAGNSIQNALSRYSDDEIIVRSSRGLVKDEDGAQGLTVINSDMRLSKHAFLEDYKEHLGDEIFDYFIFAAVRNPYDRFISWHAFKRHFLNKDKDQIPLSLLKETDNPERISDCIKLNGKIYINDIIRFENLDMDFKRICDQLGLDIPVLPFKNRSIRSLNYKDYYNGPLIKKVSEIYMEDIELFNYAY